jgi:hypothetical protein
MTPLNLTDARCALFASALQRSDRPSTAMVAAAIRTAVADLGLCGCVDRMAQEFGDHPEAASERMQWASQLTAELQATALEVTPTG